MVAVPNPSTAAAGAKSLASTWNTDVRDADTYFLENLGGFGHRNGLVNSHFDIWQGGTSFTVTSLATSKYCADQWYVRTNGTSNVAVTQVAGPTGQRYAMQVQRVASNNNTTVIEVMQPLETPESYRFAGQTCQLKLNLKAGALFSPTSSLVTVKVTHGTGTDQAPPASGWTGTTDALSTTQAITTTATDYSFDVTIPSGATQIQCSVSWTPTGTAGATDLVVVGAAQLTVGKCASWERLPYQQELAIAQRYYESIPAAAAGDNGYLMTGACQTPTQLEGFIYSSVTMRKVPNGSVSSAAHFKLLVAGALSAACSTAVANYGTGKYTCWTFTRGSGTHTTGHVGELLSASASAAIILDARL